MHTTTPARWGALVLAVLAAAGCATDPNKPYPVSGEILYEDGQPAKELAGGSVTFVPAEGRERGASYGSIEEDGTFTLSSKAEGDGAVPGKHQVEIEPPGIELDDDNPRARRPRAVIDRSSAVQEVTVEPRSNTITLKVKRASSKTR